MRHLLSLRPATPWVSLVEITDFPKNVLDDRSMCSVPHFTPSGCSVPHFTPWVPGVWYRLLRWCEMWYLIIRVIVSENWRKSSHWIQIFSISDEFQNFEKYFQNSFRYFLKFQIFPKTRFPVYSVSVWWLRMLYWKGGRIPRICLKRFPNDA